MLPILQFAAASWWNLGVTLAIIVAPAVPISFARGLIVRNVGLRG